MVTGRFLGRLCREKPGLVTEREEQPAGRHHSANGAFTPWGPQPETLDGLHLFPDPAATRAPRLSLQRQSLSSQASGQGPGAGLASVVKGRHGLPLDLYFEAMSYSQPPAAGRRYKHKGLPNDRVTVRTAQTLSSGFWIPRRKLRGNSIQ